MKTSTLQIRVSADLRKNADRVLSRIGMDMSTAVRMFICQVVYKNGIPFEVKAPASDAELLETISVDDETQTLMDAVDAVWKKKNSKRK